MFYKFKKGKQNELIQKAIVKAGSERKLSKITNIPKGSIYPLKFEKRNLSDDYANKLCNYLGINIKNMGYIKKLPSNWGQIKGGKILIKKKIEEGTFGETIKRLRVGSSKYMKEWHKNMKEKSPKEYYIWQYERFKKIGRGYTFSLKDKTPVRNKLEKKIGDFLISESFKFKYEPYINVKGKAYFPDFKINNNLIEVTEWKHPDKNKILKLKLKIKDYKKNGFEIIFFIPQNFRKFYKEIDDSIVSALPEIKAFLMPP